MKKLGKKPKLGEIEKIFKRGENFEIARSKYITLTGVDIPQEKSYTEKHSAVSKLAERYGYTVKVIPEILVFEKKK